MVSLMLDLNKRKIINQMLDPNKVKINLMLELNQVIIIQITPIKVMQVLKKLLLI
jgi:hypothetical protein